MQTLRAGAAHGHTIMQSIKRGSDDVLRVEQGSMDVRFSALFYLPVRPTQWCVGRRRGRGVLVRLLRDLRARRSIMAEGLPLERDC